MATIGELAEIINSTELHLVVTNAYLGLTDLVLNVARPEKRTATTDGGPIYSYGKGDHWFTGVLTATTPELSSLNTLSQLDANGAPTSTPWTIVATDVSGTSKTFACDGYLRDYQVKKGGEEGLVSIEIFVRIKGDTINIT